MKELNCFFIFFFCPVEVVTAKHIYKLCNFIKCICLFPGTAVSETSIFWNCFHVFHEIFFCINGFDSHLIHNFLIYPKCKISCISRNSYNISILICDHILNITLRKLINDIICHNRVIQTFQPSGILECSTHFIVDFDNVYGRISCRKNRCNLLLTCVCICRSCNNIDI